MIQKYINKAKSNLAAAELCFDNGLYDATANRAYYAALQAAIAALASIGVKRAKADHRQIQADFCEKLIKRQKVYPARVKSYLMVMQGARNQADYTALCTGKKLARQQIERAGEMITLIEKELETCVSTLSRKI